MVAKPNQYRIYSNGLTLIEVMLVISIMAVIMTIGVPSMFRSLQRDPIRQASEAILDGCNKARAQAILTGRSVDLVFDLFSGTLRTANVSGGNVGAGLPPALAEVSGIADLPQRSKHDFGFSAALHEELEILILGVNYIEKQQEEAAYIRFFPNGTSDDFTVVFRWEDKLRQIDLEVATGLPSLEVHR
jgi:prepilin-type N-terminal cleavage/methylation domain-containing protein